MATERDDGGPIYPFEYIDPEPLIGRAVHPGMSLRDYVAAAALPAVISAVYAQQTTMTPDSDKDMAENLVVEQAFCFADAFLRALAELVGALRNIIQSAKLLQQNSEGCAVDHFAHDFDEQGMPGWLADTQAHIVEAEAVLSHAKQGGSDG